MIFKCIRHLVLGLAAAAISLGVIAAVSPALAAKPAIYLKKGEAVAVGGYDLTSYQTGAGIPVKGAAQFAIAHNGATYHFANAQNAAAFKANPAKYLPAYGGYCAYALARNQLAAGDPLLYDVVNGRLFLNFSKGTQKTWRKDPATEIRKGDANWPAVLNK